MWTADILIYKHVAASVLLGACQTFQHCIFRLFSHTNCTVTVAFNFIISLSKGNFLLQLQQFFEKIHF